MLKGTLTAMVGLLALGTGTALADLPNGKTDSVQVYLSEAQRLVATGNFRAAEIQLKNAVQANPDNSAARIALADVYLKEGNPVGAESEIRLARQHGATEERTVLLLARSLLAEGKLDLLFQQVKPANRPAQEESAVRATLGLAHLGLQETDNAKALFEQAQQLDPGNLDARLGEARIFIAERDVNHAASEVDFVLARDPNRSDALILKSEILATQGDTQGALDQLSKVLEADPNDIPAHTARANILMAANKVEDAQKDIDAILSKQPGQLNANYLRALTFAKGGKYEDADSVLQKLSGQLGQFLPALYLAGTVKFELKQYAQADDALTKVIARDPGNANARRVLARVALAERDNARAISTLQPLIDANPKDGDGLTLMAQAYANQGKLDKSLDYYQQAAVLRPDDPAMQTNVELLRMDAGHVDQGLAGLQQLSETPGGAKSAGPVLILSALRLGRTDEAAKAAEALVKDKPNDVTDRNLLGMVRVAQKNYADAEKIFSDIVREDPKYLAAQRNLAAVYVLSGRFDDAEKAYQQILATTPTDIQALTSLANIAVQEKNPDQAAEFLQRAQSASAQDPGPGINLMQLYASQKQWPKAVAVGQDLLAKFPKSGAVLNALGNVQLASGDVQGGVATFQHLTDIAPKSVGAWEAYAHAQEQAKNMLAAHAAYLQALTIEPTNERLRSDLVNVDYQAGGVDAALKTARSFAKTDPVSADILSATALELASRHADALSLLAQGQKEHPDTKIVVFTAVLERTHGQAQVAESQLKDWLMQHDADWVARQALGEIYLADKQLDHAQTEFERLEADQPKNVVALNNLAWIYQQKHDPRARSVAEQAYGLAPNAPAIADTLGWILVSSGDAKAAVPFLQKAAASSAENMDIQYHLAVALQRTGQADQARTLLQRIVADKKPFENRSDAEKLLDQLQHG